jgi:hypothetical protein
VKLWRSVFVVAIDRLVRNEEPFFVLSVDVTGVHEFFIN